MVVARKYRQFVQNGGVMMDGKISPKLKMKVLRMGVSKHGCERNWMQSVTGVKRGWKGVKLPEGRNQNSGCSSA